jgi:hypothetical protein
LRLHCKGRSGGERETKISKKKGRKVKDTGGTSVEISKENLTIRYISVCTVNFICSLPYSFPVLHVIE